MTGAMRGFGAPQVCFAYESHMDDIATALGIDPLEIRLLNAFEEGSISPTGQMLQSVVVKESLLRAAERFGWNTDGKAGTNGNVQSNTKSNGNAITAGKGNGVAKQLPAHERAAHEPAPHEPAVR
jgi:CO/xanthine dehydrogenase Mo-binding subunit